VSEPSGLEFEPDTDPAAMFAQRPALADAYRDALALLRARLSRDTEAQDAIVMNMGDPRLTALALAAMLADLARSCGDGLAEVDEWQRAKGLR
jgi:hypothetical protein